MGLTWRPWTSVSEGSSTPGAPVAAVPWGDSFALFIADPGGSIYAIKAVPGYGWEVVPGHNSKPGAPVTAVASGNRFTLFMADVNGEIFTTSGIPYQGWDPWTSVSEGSSIPGAAVAAVPWGDSFALFIADPGGSIYAIKAVPGYGWEVVPGRNSKPGAPVTAVASGNRFTLFMADVNGEIFTTSGVPYQGWDPWTSVSEGSSMPGAPVAAVPWGESFALFIADPGGGIYAIKAVPGYGWEVVPGRNSKPGARVTAVPWYKPPTSAGFAQPLFLLFMADTSGEIYTTSGLPYQRWEPWTRVTGVSGTPGALVATLPRAVGLSPFTLFIADSGGGVRETTTSDPPATPENLRVTSVTAQTIDTSWTESTPVSVELDGFLSSIRRIGGGTTAKIHGPAERTASYTGLVSGVEYEIRIEAFNSNGYSLSSTPVLATTPNPTAPPPSLSANITNIPMGNYGLLIEGSNFGKSEQVLITVDWTVGTDPTVAFPLGPVTTDAVVGEFGATFTGVVPFGFCPISVPFGEPQPPQSFQVTARGLTSNKTASTTAGPFTCP